MTPAIYAAVVMVLQWQSQTGYAITELVFFLLACVVIFGTTAIVVTVLLMHRKNRSFFAFLRPIFQHVFTTAIAFTRKGDGNLRVVFLGYKEKDVGPGKLRHTILRMWVHIYLTLVCGIVLLWFVSVLSNAVMYSKTSTCLDLNTGHMRCFLLPTSEDIPPGVQEIINDYKGDTVPCQRIKNYLILTNTTFDIDVICYHSQLDPLSAFGVAYGVMKTMVFVLTIALHVFIKATHKLLHYSNTRFARVIFITHTIQLAVSLSLAVLIVAVIVSIHRASGTMNTSYDYLKGEPFLNYSSVALLTITLVVTFGLFPWWAFKPLETAHPSCTDSDERLREAIDLMILHHQFSTYYQD